MAKTINLDWDGYYPESKTSDGHLLNISKHKCSGIYAVYAGSASATDSSKCNIRKLLYIGESKNVVSDRLTDKHENYKCWTGKLQSGEKLYFSIADVDSGDRARAEAALIYKCKPTCNDQGTDSFDYDTTTIESAGNHFDIPNSFTVYRS